MSREEVSLFFRLIARRHEKASLILTSNKSFIDWAEIFGNPQIGDIGGPGAIGTVTARSRFNRFGATGPGSVPNVFAGTVPSFRFQNGE